ncbi:hypothetical protein [Serratia liquefaciens]|uniref:hypothetical protein n=1 Tax=Serratia liquefaciens TaxID=614 RepID=UPI00215783E9|nr:hypothetical protein [Serratia liquefaciens]
MSHLTLTTSVALMSLLLLSGCQSGKKTITKITAGITQADEKVKREASELKQCQQNLNALGTLRTETYLAKKKVFDELMAGASQYAGIRSQVNPQTQDTVDALYRYQVSYQCAEINQALLAELAKRGGATK